MKIRLMLDSGAFSAWNRKEHIDIDKYIKFVKKNRKFIDTYVNMDVIPVNRSQKEVEISASKSYENLQYMKTKGLNPIPVFHQGERFYWLKKLVDDGESYIGLSTYKQLWVKDHVKWLDEVFTMLTDDAGRPLVKTHGFGVMSFRILTRYPWETVDSTTWSLSPSYGKIFVPPYVGGKPDYTCQPIVVVISGVLQASTVYWEGKLRKIKANQKRQFDLSSPIVQDYTRRFLEEECGLSVAQARYDDDARRRAVLTYFNKFQENMKVVRFRHRRQRLLT